jgi:hypothetical protein
LSRAQITETEVGRVDGENVAGRIGSGVGLQLAGIVLVADPDLAEPALEEDMAFVDLVAGATGRLALGDAAGPIIDGRGLQLDASADL